MLVLLQVGRATQRRNTRLAPAPLHGIEYDRALNMIKYSLRN